MICPLVRLNQTIFNISEITEQLVQNITPNVKPDWSTISNVLNAVCRHNYHIRHNVLANFSAPNMLDLIDSISLQGSLQTCANHEINKLTVYNCSETFQKAIMRTGPCYLFNYLPSSEIFSSNM